jgi:hypothetical protein
MFAALALMAQSNAQRASLLPQRTFGPLHQFREFGDRRARFRMCLEQLHIVLRILFTLARRLLRHFMFPRMVVKSRSSTPNSLVKRTDVNKMFGDDHLVIALAICRAEIDKIISDLQAREAFAVERGRRKRWQRIIENAAAFDRG